MTCRSWYFFVALIILAGCNAPSQQNPTLSATSGNSTVLLSVKSDAKEHAQSVDMALKLAGFSLDEGRRVVLFFNVEGVTIPVEGFPADFAFQEDQPIKSQLAELITRGADVHVCPICMKALGVEESDLIQGAKVTTRPSLFANIGPGTVVFTY